MHHGAHALETRAGHLWKSSENRRTVLLLMLVATTLGAAGLLAAAKSPSTAPDLSVRARAPRPTVTVLTGSPGAISATAARLLLRTAPGVVVADEASRADVTAAAAIAIRAHAPLLLAPAPSSETADSGSTAASTGGTRSAVAGGAAQQEAALRAEVRALDPRAVLAVGMTSAALSAELPGVQVVTSAQALPRAAAAAPLRHVIVLQSSGTSAAAIAASTTATVAGAEVIVVSGDDPRADPSAIRAIAAARPMQVVAIGSSFGPANVLGARVAVARTGLQLPGGGGEVLFPLRRIVALYGSPRSAALGALGQQGLTASIARAQAVAGRYRYLSRAPVLPAFEIIATIAQGSPGQTGGYSYQTPVAVLRRWIRAATAARMYVILDLQPGRDSLLQQAKRYSSLLAMPNVGLALDPEWKLQPRQLPLHQIGQVSITEVNSVVTWLAALTALHHLPQKLLELHQFRLSMIQDEWLLDTRHDDLAIVVNMDGQGAPFTKQQTWAAITAAAPRGVYFGWKDFYKKDRPMLDPAETIGRTPEPVLISYQ